MGNESPGYFTREEVRGGLPARRASTLLFAIEKRTAVLAARARRAMATYVTERTEADRERDFLDALAAGRLGARPRLQDLERYAPAWAGLVPADAALRATVGMLIGEKYRLPRRAVPRIRQALGLDDPQVRAGFERLYGRPVENIYVDSLTLRERVAWRRARAAERMETLPPFWTAFGLTFTEMVGTGLLAVPIALAGVGAGPAIVLLVVFGVLNVVTLAAVVETITRDGNMRYGTAYFGRLVGDFLGRPGMALLSVTLLAFYVLVIVVVALGFGTTLHAATGVPVAVWIALLLAVDLAFLRRESLDATIASALAIGAINIAVVLLISLLAAPHVDPANLAAGAPAAGHVASQGGWSVLALAFGVLMACYSGHTSAANVAKIVLARDPGGRELLLGCVLAVVAAVGVYTAFVVATLGAVGPVRLSSEQGTPIDALADTAGPGVQLLGGLYVLLALGIGSIHMSLGLANQVREYLPAATGRFRRLLTDRNGRWLVAAAPTIAVYGLVELQVLTGQASFAGVLSIVGTLAIAVLCGIFPVIMVASARRRGDYVPETVAAIVGHPLVVVGVTGLFLLVLLGHAAFVWDGFLERLMAALAAGLSVWVAVLAWREGAFRRRTVVELRRDETAGDRARFTVTDDGRPLVTRVLVTDGEAAHEVRSAAGELGLFRALRAVGFELPPREARDLKVWVHAVDGDGGTTALPATVRLEMDGQNPTDHPMTGELRLALSQPVSRVEVRLVDAVGGTAT
jgi:amino acid permease